ncbi:sulfur carrier protein ThiS adenylyltransferase ThiF [Aerococcus christensenii]|uniref:sulfur carrier protein ThiS adenylyltransferase ThiF n=1 Tax=Aerococcus christensenii TaxID=87541 RepID=UPI0023A92818|nr:sulfur carrier protein ThiS adenylyltransferase ThiF [Aerococcus christensenii]WEB71569.1 sulfur carrier protein ThiS adenylyltransferase ThiF [Aerococcus christensenii]
MTEENRRSAILQRQDPQISDRFAQEKVTILGCGGLGSNVAMMLARAGVGELVLYDDDQIEYSNLNRQNYSFSEVGQSKVYTCKKRLDSTLPYIKVEAYSQRVTPDNLEVISQQSRLFIEAFDNQESKRMVLDYFMEQEDKYLISAFGLSGLGSLSDIQVKYYNNICLIGDFKTTVNQGLYLPYVSVMASLEALEALKWIKNGGYYGNK